MYVCNLAMYYILCIYGLLSEINSYITLSGSYYIIGRFFITLSGSYYSIGWYRLQRLVDICAAYGDIHDIKFNHAKTVCMYLPSKGNCTYFFELAKIVFCSEVQILRLIYSAGLRSVEAPGQQCYRKVVDVMIISS